MRSTPPNATLADVLAPFIGVIQSNDGKDESRMSEYGGEEFVRILELKRREGHL